MSSLILAEQYYSKIAAIVALETPYSRANALTLVPLFFFSIIALRASGAILDGLPSFLPSAFARDKPA